MIENPYTALQEGAAWIAGNLHAHSEHSDGRCPSQRVVEIFAGLGHGYMALTDHDRLATTQELADLDDNGMILIPGNEVTRDGQHILHVGASALVVPDPDRQKVLDDISGHEGFAIINHPNWQQAFDHCSLELLTLWQGYTGIEIYNGVVARLAGSPYATSKWDMLLSAGRRSWGFAGDDFHRPGDEGRGWNVALISERTPKAVLGALQTGAFYASTGVVISAISVSGHTIEVETENAHKLIAVTEFGKRLMESEGNHIKLDLQDPVSYVRIACMGAGEQWAWTQPFFVS